MVICKNCGAFMRFDPETQTIKCDHCDSAVSPLGVRTEDEVESSEEYETAVYTCPQCGGEILSDDDTAATFCSYCGAASVVLEKRLEKVRKPAYIIPFKKTKQECFENYKAELKKALFAPSYMQQDMLIERLRGIYMPYWLYRIKHEGNIYVNGIHQYRRGEYIHVDTYSISAFLKAHSDGIAFDGSASFSDNLSRGIAPFDTKEKQAFNPAYISGFYADVCDVAADVYEDNAAVVAETDISNTISRHPELKMYTMELDKATGEGAASEIESELDYFPVWFLACKSRDGKGLSYAVVNGQTGRVAMDVPIDYKKYILGSLILSQPIILILNLFLTLSPQTILFCGAVFALATGYLLNSQLNLIYTRNLEFDDEGKAYKRNSDRGDTQEEEDFGDIGNIREFHARAEIAKKQRMQMGIPKKSTLRKKDSRAGMSIASVLFVMVYVLVKSQDLLVDIFGDIRLIYTVFAVAAVIVVAAMLLKKHVNKERPDRLMYAPWESKLSVLVKPGFALLVCAFVFIVNPVHDMFYYAGAIISLIAALFGVNDLVVGHNKLALRKPPQFNKRGGDI